MKLFAMAAAAALLFSLAPVQAVEKVSDDLAVATVLCPDGTRPEARPNHPNNVLPLLQCPGSAVFDHPGVYAAERRSVCDDGRLPVTQMLEIWPSGQTRAEAACRDNAGLSTFDSMTANASHLSESVKQELFRSMRITSIYVLVESVNAQNR
jgi:hypothetical protein